jgi:hypothetical protein
LFKLTTTLLNAQLAPSKVYFFLVGGCARHLRNPATKCDLPIGYFIPLTNREVAFLCRISKMARASAYQEKIDFSHATGRNQYYIRRNFATSTNKFFVSKFLRFQLGLDKLGLEESPKPKNRDRDTYGLANVPATELVHMFLTIFQKI